MKASMFASDIFSPAANYTYTTAHEDPKLNSLINALSNNDSATMYHSNGVGRLFAGMCADTELGDIVPDQISCTRAAIAHDIGKLIISNHVLQSGKPLTEEEWLLIKQHPVTGFQTYRNFFDYPGAGLSILMHHRFQANPYPNNKDLEDILTNKPYEQELLRDPNILMSCAALAIADCTEAMHPRKPHNSHNYRSRDYSVEDLPELVRKSILSTPLYTFNRQQKIFISELVEYVGQISIAAVADADSEPKIYVA